MTAAVEVASQGSSGVPKSGHYGESCVNFVSQGVPKGIGVQIHENYAGVICTLPLYFLWAIFAPITNTRDATVAMNIRVRRRVDQFSNTLQYASSANSAHISSMSSQGVAQMGRRVYLTSSFNILRGNVNLQ